jgi:hypothetical protein
MNLIFSREKSDASPILAQQNFDKEPLPKCIDLSKVYNFL